MKTAKKASRLKRFLWLVLPVAFVIGMGTTTAYGGHDNDKTGEFLLSPKQMFLHYCAACHGPTGKGDGRYYVTSLTPKPADLTAKKISSRDEKYLFEWISRGSAAMGKPNLCPPWGKTIQERHIKGIIGYLKTLNEEN